MLTIGCHLSKRRGYLEMAKEAASINANTFQYFTRSPRGSEQAVLDEEPTLSIALEDEGAVLLERRQSERLQPLVSRGVEELGLGLLHGNELHSDLLSGVPQQSVRLSPISDALPAAIVRRGASAPSAPTPPCPNRYAS